MGPPVFLERERLCIIERLWHGSVLSYPGAVPGGARSREPIPRMDSRARAHLDASTGTSRCRRSGPVPLKPGAEKNNGDLVFSKNGDELVVLSDCLFLRPVLERQHLGVLVQRREKNVLEGR